MDKKREIIEHNREILYHPKKKYINIYNLLNDYPKIRRMLLNIYNLMDQTETLMYRDKITLLLSNKTLKKLTGYKTDMSVNPKINYLCTVGFFGKLNDEINEKSYLMQEWKKENPTKETINTIILVKYTDQTLQEINANIEELNELGITPCNIRDVSLRLKGLSDMAEETYYRRRNAYTSKLAGEYAILETDLIEEMDLQLQDYGYTDREYLKAWIIERMLERNWSKGKAEWFIKLVNPTLRLLYNYHKPTQQEKALYKLNSNSFIYTSLE